MRHDEGPGDEGVGDDDPVSRLLPPDDRIWRHPSEVAGHGTSRNAKSPPRRPRRLWPFGVAAWVLSGVVVGLGLGAVGIGRPVRTVPVAAVELVVAPGSVGPLTAAPEAIVGIADHMRAVVVTIRTDGPRGPAAGTGVVFRSDGHVLTNHHVVDGARTVVVVMADGSQLDASVVGGDAETDVAVIKVKSPAADVATAVIGSAAGLRVGQMAIALGPPSGAGSPTLAVGVVRALGLEAEIEGRPALVDMIQTDLPVTMAASGGPLVDAAGAVIGITTDLVGSTPKTGRVGYATPIDVAREVAVQLITTGRVTRSWLGIEGENLDTGTAASLGLSGGARVKTVAAGSPASQSGLTPGDVVTSLDGLPVRSLSGLKALLRAHRPGGMVSLSVLGRDGPRSVRVRLVERTR
ncbi:MAG: S1C family serine protease [Acidimicrobiales bacterium]